MMQYIRTISILLFAVFFFQTLTACTDRQKSCSTSVENKTEKTPIIKPSDVMVAGKYRTVQIGDRLWMAENLNEPMDSSYCYDADQKNCEKYGRLYSFNAAMKACPSGWILPSVNDWEAMLGVAGEDTSAWKEINSYFLNHLPGIGTTWLANGKYHYGGMDEFAVYWTSSYSLEDKSSVWTLNGFETYGVYDLHKKKSPINGHEYNKIFFYSVRCVKKLNSEEK